MHKYMLPITALSCAALACATLVSNVPTFAWQPDFDHVLVEYACYGGLVPTGFYDNYIPPVRLHGDGTLTWVENDGSARRVLQSTLSETEVTGVLQHVADAGYFGWKDDYPASEMIYDGTDCRLSVHLDSTSKTVWMRAGSEAPPGFADLVAWLTSGAGASGQDYVPETGWLSAIPTQPSETPPVLIWPDEGLGGVRLSEALQAVPAEGEALATAWRIVNGDRYAQVEYLGIRYQLVVQVAGVTDRWPGSP